MSSLNKQILCSNYYQQIQNTKSIITSSAKYHKSNEMIVLFFNNQKYFKLTIIIFLPIRLSQIQKQYYMRQLQPLALRKSNYDENGYQNLFLSQTKQNKTMRIQNMLGNIKFLMQQISLKNKSSIQSIVKYKSANLKQKHNINLNSICSLVQLKYIILNIIEFDNENININAYQTPSKINTTMYPQSVSDSPQLYGVPKKTSIYIDFDFTQYLEKAQQQLFTKQKMIEKLQDMMIDKDNQIDILEDQNDEMRRQIQEIALKNCNDKAEHENQKSGIQAKFNDLKQENAKLKDNIKNLGVQILQLQEDQRQHPDQFLRRCLITQAISIQHFLQSNYQ